MRRKIKLTPARLKQIIKEEKAKLNLSEAVNRKSNKNSDDSFKSYEKLLIKESKLVSELRKILIAKKKIKEQIKSGK